jgi:hypothetical protein
MIKSKLNVIYNNAREAKEVVTEHETKADMARYFNWLVSKGHTQSSLMCVVHAMVQWLFIMMLRYLMVDLFVSF